MPTYRPRATVEAIQWIGGNIHEIWDAFSCAHIYGPTPEKNPDWLIVTTAHGEVRADIGDWIVRGTTGLLMVCRDADFGTTYEPTEPTNMIAVRAALAGLEDAGLSNLRPGSLALGLRCDAIKSFGLAASQSLIFLQHIRHDYGARLAANLGQGVVDELTDSLIRAIAAVAAPENPDADTED